MQNQNGTGFKTSSNITKSAIVEISNDQRCIWFACSMTVSIAGAILCWQLIQAVRQRWTMTEQQSTGNQNGTKFLVLHMAVIEILMCGVLLPMNFTQTFYGHYTVSVLLCTLIQAPFGIVRTLANWSDSVLAANRLAAVCFPILYRNSLATLRANIPPLLAIWFISIAIFIPPIVGWGSRFEPVPPLYSCGITLLDNKSIAVRLNFFLNTYIPLALTASCYLTMLGSIIYRKVVSKSTHSRSRERALKLSLTLCLSAAWRATCYFPFTIAYAYNQEIFVRFPMLTAWLRTGVSLGYAANPVIFFGIHKEFRTALATWWTTWIAGLKHDPVQIRPTMELADYSPRSENTSAPKRTILQSK